MYKKMFSNGLLFLLTPGISKSLSMEEVVFFVFLQPLNLF